MANVTYDALPISNLWRIGKPLCYYRGDSIEVLLGYQQLKLIEKRSRKARVSSLCIRTTAKKLASEEYPGSDFKASNGWLFRFLRRHKIQF